MENKLNRIPLGAASIAAQEFYGNRRARASVSEEYN
jgi:hypothetical protein